MTERDLVVHGEAELPDVHVDAYNARLRSGRGFVGDHASKSAFFAIVNGWRERVGRAGVDPFGSVPSARLGGRKLEKMMGSKDLVAAAIVHAAVDEYGRALAGVIARFLRQDSWRATERIVIGGGFRASRLGELAIGRAEIALRSAGKAIELRPIRNDPNEAGLLGAAMLVPSVMLGLCDTVIAVDVGGSHFRVGLVELAFDKPDRLRRSRVAHLDIWRHADDRPSRRQAVDGLIHMLRRAVRRARKDKLKLAPIVAIGCPGTIRPDGSIAQGSQNLPGNWESRRFNLPDSIRAAIPQIGGRRTIVTMHNDAVAQGLSELSNVRDVRRWGVLTIGTGLGNARLTNHAAPDPVRNR